MTWPFAVTTFRWEIGSPSCITCKLHAQYLTDYVLYLSHFKGFHTWRLYIVLWCTIIYSVLAILAQVVFHIIWCFEGKGWSVAHSWWAKLVGLARYLSLTSPFCWLCILMYVHISTCHAGTSGLQLIMDVIAGARLGNHHQLSTFLPYSYLLQALRWSKSLEAGFKIHVGWTSLLGLSE